ncbi:MAG TPA: hypothetical protein VGQ32_07180 [Thermoanaerobaculia bacterium]|jgi:hypothetical protein|nr:hypothetical protein [Thermoanaerobaculia bacterium]
MRKTVWVMAVSLALVAGEALSATPKAPPADVGSEATELGGKIPPGFPFNLPNGTGAIAFIADPAGHPVGLYSRTPLPARPPSK